MIGVDFDGTIVEHEFPEIGKPKPFVFESLKKLQAEGHLLVLFTCRENPVSKTKRKYLDEAVDFCRANGIVFDAVNESIDGKDFREGEYHVMRKPYCHVYIDDRSVCGSKLAEIDWLKILECVRNLSEIKSGD